MSALLFALQRGKIDILVDTKAIGCSNMAKAWPLVHLPAIVCGRGPAALILDVALRSATMAATFDELARNMPAVLDAALKAGALNLAHLSLRDRRAEIYLVGISPQHVAADGSRIHADRFGRFDRKL
jgi:hypothetical protein